MGNQTTKPNPTKLYQSQHPILSCSYPIENTNPLQLFLTISAINKQQYKKWQQKIIIYRALVPILQIQTLYLPIEVQYVQEYLCGNTGVIQARYRASPLLLSEELDNRIKIMQPFTEEQILYLAYIMLYIAHYLHKNNKIIGDVRPKNIFLFEDASFYDQISAYAKTIKYNYKTLLAPQQINDLQNNKQNCQNQISSQNFSIGMTLMGLILLHDQEMLYDTDRNLFDLQGFKKQLQLIANCTTYSTVLRKIVIGLLKINIQERLTSNQIFSMLQNYRNDILNLNRIKIDQKKIQNKLRQKLDNINLQKFAKSQINPLSFTFSFGQITSGLKINKISIIQMLNNDQNNNNSLIINDNLFSNQLFTPSQQQKLSRFNKQNQEMNIKLNENKLEKIQFKDNQSFQHSMHYKNKKLFSRSINIKSKTQINYNDKQNYQNPKPFNLSSMQINARSSNKNLNLNLQYAQAQTSSICEQYQPSKFSQQNSTPIAKFDNLEDCCLSTKSIKNYNGNKQKNNQKLSDLFKNIDEQLKLSREMFPNS